MNFKNKIRTLLRKNNFSFSGSGEDITLKGIFLDKFFSAQKGFYIDIGAYHPYQESNTYMFYLQGWNGINIEPRPGSKQLFDKFRPRDKNIQMGIAAEPGSMTYYFHEEANRVGANTFSQEYLLKFPKEVIRTTKNCSVPVMPLKDILDSIEMNVHPRDIDFMDVDCEGMDLQVLQTNDWNTYRPKIVLAELEGSTLLDVMNNETTQYMESVGYHAICKNYLVGSYATVFYKRNDLK